MFLVSPKQKEDRIYGGGRVAGCGISRGKGQFPGLKNLS